MDTNCLCDLRLKTLYINASNKHNTTLETANIFARSQNYKECIFVVYGSTKIDTYLFNNRYFAIQ